MAEAPFKERRLFPRFTVHIPVDFSSNKERSFLSGYTNDISVEGIGLVVTRPIDCGTPLELYLNLPDNSEKIFIKGRVIWSKPVEEGKYRVGIKLHSLALDPIPLVLRIINYNLSHHTL
ncbi:MAG: PilZ domain-containing protein [Candidatus Omnitrophica bacterium]|nr:PilZ domain-containing protein [Candidatus Omnitrophota bacterium]